MRIAIPCVLLIGACGGGNDNPMIDAAAASDAPPDVAIDAMADAPPDAPPPVVTQMIGPAGGMVMIPGAVTLTIPSDALGAMTMITVSQTTMPAPGGALTPIYKLEPAGLVFARPVRVTMTLPMGTASADLYLSRPAGQTGYDNIGGVVQGGTLVGDIVHFSTLYGGAAMSTRTVTGSQVIANVSASAVEQTPVDLSAFPVAALVEDGAGGYTTITGVGHADGTFTIDNVPDGPYWLRVPGTAGGSMLYRTSASAIDAGYPRIGRTTQTIEAANTQLSLNLTNLAPWQDGDSLELVSSEANSFHFALEAQAISGAPQVGDTALTALTLDMTDTTLGTPGHITSADHVFVTQLATRTSGGVSYQAVSRLYEPAAFTVTPGQTTMLSGAFVDVSAQSTVSLQVDGASLEASLTEEMRVCEVAFSQWGVALHANPGAPAHFGSGPTVDLAIVPIPEHTTTTLTAPNLGYGVPSTGIWTPQLTATFFDVCRFVPPGATSAVRVASGFSYDLTPASAVSIGARLGQVRSPTINGTSIYTTMVGYGTTPTLSWAAPSTGTPTSYEVTVFHVRANAAGAGVRDLILKMKTDQTSVRIPAGYLMTGSSYVFAIAAHADMTPVGTVHRWGVPHDFAQVVSIMSTP